MEDLKDLAGLLDHLNNLGKQISELTQRPATIGHTGEFIASKVFDIKLEESAAAKAIDGHFQSGPLAGKSVNVKWYGKQESILDITPDALPDYYLVMTGPKSSITSSRGSIRPWLIDSIFLFDANILMARLRKRGVKIGIATSVRKQDWQDFQIYPVSRSSALKLTEDQASRQTV